MVAISPVGAQKTAQNNSANFNALLVKDTPAEMLAAALGFSELADKWLTYNTPCTDDMDLKDKLETRAAELFVNEMADSDGHIYPGSVQKFINKHRKEIVPIMMSATELGAIEKSLKGISSDVCIGELLEELLQITLPTEDEGISA